MSVLTPPSRTDEDFKRNRYRGFGSDQLSGANRGGEGEEPWGGHNRFEGSTGFGSDDYFGRSKRSESALLELPDVHHLPVCAVAECMLCGVVWCGVVCSPLQHPAVVVLTTLSSRTACPKSLAGCVCTCVCACVCACVCPCVRAYVLAWVGACVRACVCAHACIVQLPCVCSICTYIHVHCSQ